MTLYQFSYRQPNMLTITWDYHECDDDIDAAYKAQERANELKYQLMDVREYYET